MKKLFLVVAVAAFITYVNAQDTYKPATTTPDNKTFTLSLGVEPAIPVGKFNDYSGFGLGGSLQGEVKPGRRVGFTVNAGFIDYFGKTVNGFKYDDFGYWPVLGGVKLYMSDKSYIHGQGGAGIGTDGLGTSFWYGAGLGFNLGKAVNAELKYTGWEQNEVTTTATPMTPTPEPPATPTPGTPGYSGVTGTNGSGSVGYGGHYSTISVRLSYLF